MAGEATDSCLDFRLCELGWFIEMSAPRSYAARPLVDAGRVLLFKMQLGAASEQRGCWQVQSGGSYSRYAIE